jgi:hypothetical protein
MREPKIEARSSLSFQHCVAENLLAIKPMCQPRAIQHRRRQLDLSEEEKILLSFQHHKPARRRGLYLAVLIGIL